MFASPELAGVAPVQNVLERSVRHRTTYHYAKPVEPGAHRMMFRPRKATTSASSGHAAPSRRSGWIGTDCAGYLGDIGMPPPHGPMDVAGWFEAYLGGVWHAFDRRNNLPRIGRTLIGRDALAVPISNTSGPNTLLSFRGWTDKIAESLASEVPV